MTPKQTRFVAEYLVDLNASAAALRAGYSAKTAGATGHENLKKPEVAAAIRAAMAERSARTLVNQDKVVLELAKIAFADLADVVSWGSKEVAIGYDDEGRRLPPQDLGDAVVVMREEAPFVSAIDSDQLTPEARGAVSEVALTKDGLRIKMHDKVGALTQIGRHLGMFVDRSEHSGPAGGPVEHVHVDRPPRETREEWLARRQRELGQAAG